MSITPQHKGIYSLLFASLLSACGTFAVLREHPRNGPIIVNPNHSFLFQDQYIYSNVDQEALEKRLVELAATSKVEESWMYNSRTRFLREVGFHEDKDSVENPAHLYPNFALENDLVIQYHLHTFSSFGYISGTMSKAEIAQKLSTTNGVMAIPSDADLKTNLRFREAYKSEKVKVVTKIVDYGGILTYAFNHLENPEDSIKKYNSLWISYVSFKIGFDELVEESRKIGVGIEYKRIRNVVFQEKDITIHQNK